MTIEQFFDAGLAHSSYAVISNGQMALVDPARNPQPYYDFAAKHNARITAVIETHPHADFVSSHAQIKQDTGATIYASSLIGAAYDHEHVDEGDTVALGDVKLEILHTPGHSPDSISILLRDENGKQRAVFTGDTLFVGDVGRPDLREGVGNLKAKREELARQMYHSTRDKLMTLDKETLVYPAHGAGSLCGKSLSEDLHSTIGRELLENYALQPMSEEEFVKVLTADQPFIPKYFGHDVEVNRKGARSYGESLKAVPRLNKGEKLEAGAVVVDARPDDEFKRGHADGAFNIQNGGKFETWLGSIVGPNEKFYLIADDEATLSELIEKSAKIGYETNIKAAGLFNELNAADRATTSPAMALNEFKTQPDKFTIVDVRNTGEIAGGKLFAQAVAAPLPDLRELASTLPRDKDIVVHCAAGYRSAAGASILQAQLGSEVKVMDLGTAIQSFA